MEDLAEEAPALAGEDLVELTRRRLVAGELAARETVAEALESVPEGLEDAPGLALEVVTSPRRPPRDASRGASGTRRGLRVLVRFG